MAPTKGPVIVARVVRMTGRSLTSPGDPVLVARCERMENGRSRPRKTYERVRDAVGGGG
jgi:hypothetical protein